MFNCQKCGACCLSKTDNKWIEVSEEDAKNIDPSLLQEGDIEKYAMKQTDQGICAALKGNVKLFCWCSIYENRPLICRKIQPKDNVCMTAKL